MKPSNYRYDWLQEAHGIRLRPEQTTDIYPKDVSIRLRELREGIMGKRQIGLDGYREAVRKWPNNPDAKLMLIGRLFQREREEEAREWLETALREHPDNIFIIHANIQFCETHEEALKLGPIHGPNFSILDFPADADGTYTLAQFDAFETSLIDYYILTHNFAAAKARLNRLLAFGFTEEHLDKQFDFLLYTSEKFYQERHAHELANRILVPGSRQVNLLGLAKPKLQHAELECLYAMLPEDMSKAKLNELLELPRESLLADLRAILRDGLERYDEIVEAGLPDEALFFPIHAIRLLGILRATETLPEILDYLRMEEGFFDFWFGDFADRYILPALYFLSKDQLPVLFSYMKEPGHHAYNRAWVGELPAQVLLHEPGRCEEVVGLYKDLLEFLLTTEQEGVVDTDFITGLAIPVTMTKAPELLPAIRELYRRGLIEDSMQGNLEEIERAFEDGADASEIMALPETPFEFYSLAYRKRQRELISTEGILAPTEPTAADLIIARRREEETARRQRLLERTLAPTKTTKKKVGRNDPCPCGSGLKYKKCCLKKGI